MDDHPLLEPAAAVSDRSPNAAVSQSEGIRLIDRIIRVFGAHASDTREPGSASLFAWGTLEVKRTLGAGSFGEVFAAWDPTLRREVALKLRVPEVGALRWLDEARNLARVRHPNVLTVYGADVLAGRAGIWSELISGRTLEEELQSNGPFPQNEALRIARDIASALAAVHAAGLVHGDVKTANIMLEDGDTPRRAVLVDFGAADRMLESGEIPAYLVGTPLTMAPEVLDGQPATGASDVYGLGATLFRMLTGRYPVEAQSIDELKQAHASGNKVSLRAFVPNASPRLARVLSKALETSPVDRWPSAGAFRRALDDIVDPTRRIRARAAAIAWSAIAVAGIALIAMWIARSNRDTIAHATLSTPRAPGILQESWRRVAQQTRMGWGWTAAVLDIDGDGFDDVAGGEAGWTRADSLIRGRVLVFRGSASGLSAHYDSSLVGEVENVYFGDRLANAGDVNADGFEDLLVMDRPAKSHGVSHVHLFLGAPRGSALVRAWTLAGQEYGSYLGLAMTSAGDMNRDGFGDVLVAESRATDRLSNEGMVYLFLGTSSGLSEKPVWRARGGQVLAELGTWFRRTGDVTGDGYDDVLIGAALWDGSAVDCGQARLYLGSAQGVGAEPAWTFDGAGNNSWAGHAVVGADVNGDGYNDVVVGEPRYTDEGRPERGRVLVFHGGPKGPSHTPDWQVLGPVAYALFGYMVDRMGDLDGDGSDDIAITSSQYTDGKLVHLGLTEIYRGGPNGCENTPAWRVVGDRSDSHLGQLLVTGDLNGDSVPDLLLGAPHWGNAITERGLLLAYLGQRQPK